jgi:hypothetical protein
MMQVKMTFAAPEELRAAIDEETGGILYDERGRQMFERIPQHPVRLATAVDWNTWWVPMADAEALELMEQGAIVRFNTPPAVLNGLEAA